ncbi:hypothetical protein GCM10023319_75710 [Nocardia iowensis]
MGTGGSDGDRCGSGDRCLLHVAQRPSGAQAGGIHADAFGGDYTLTAWRERLERHSRSWSGAFIMTGSSASSTQSGTAEDTTKDNLRWHGTPGVAVGCDAVTRNQLI